MPALEPIISKLPMDWVSLGLFAIVVTLITMRWGTQHAVSFSLAAPLTLFVYGALPWTAFIGPYTDKLVNPSTQAVAVSGILAALWVLICRMMPPSAATGTYPLQSILAGLASAIIFVTVMLQLPALGTFLPLSQLIHDIFGPSYNVFWFFGAYLSLAIASR